MSDASRSQNHPQGGERREGAERFNEATEHLKEKGSAVREDLSQMSSAAREMAQEQIEHLRDSANEYLEQGKERARELSETLEKRIREQPVKSVMMAAGAGLFLGLLFARR
jgi:ElaB/YqjD/DUF883 family membrane-anchored ribosome-binding protein